MSQLILFSDVHIHPHKKSTERLQNCLDAVEWVFKNAVERQIKNIIFCGDLFHDRQKIDVLTYQKTFNLFEKYLFPNPQFNIYLLLGNHDLWHLEKWDVSSVFPLKTIPGVKIVDRPCTLNIDGLPISFMPYTHDPIEELKKIKNSSKHKILCAHIAVDGAVWNLKSGTTADVSVEHDGDMKKVSAEIFNGWDQVFLGHYHGEQKLKDDVEYIGSPLQLSFGEAFESKHFIILNTETFKKEYIKNDFSPRHFIIPEKDISKYDLNNNFIQIVVDDIASSDIIEMRNELLNNNKINSLEIKQKEKKNKDENLIDNAKAILYKREEMLKVYVEQEEKNNNLNNLLKDKLLEIGQEICKEKI